MDQNLSPPGYGPQVSWSLVSICRGKPCWAPMFDPHPFGSRFVPIGHMEPIFVAKALTETTFFVQGSAGPTQLGPPVVPFLTFFWLGGFPY